MTCCLSLLTFKTEANTLDEVQVKDKTRSTCDKVIETGFLVATWLALVSITVYHLLLVVLVI